MKQTTATDKFIEVATAFWKASAELAEAASSTSQEHGRRTACQLMNKLDDKLKMLLDDWNGELFEGELAVVECSSSNDISNKGCEIFTAKPNEGMCESCAERAYDRQQERLMEDGGVDDSAYRRDMRESGRGHLVR